MAREKDVRIATTDGKVIYGRQIGDHKKPLIIFSHGLTDDMNGRVPYNGAWFFADNNFSTFRFSYYDSAPRARRLTECTIETHSQDLDTVVKYFRQKTAKPIFVVGHSFGGLTILLSRAQAFDAAVLWDATHPKSTALNDAIYNPKLGAYIMQWGVSFIVSKAMVEQIKKLDIDKALSRYHIPTLVVSATKGPLAKTNRQYAQTIQPKPELVEIPTDHCFTNEGMQARWFEATLNWLNRQLST